MNSSSQGTRPNRSAGTTYPIDVLRNRFRGPSRAAVDADIRAIDNGEARRIACQFRGTYGSYPRRFRQHMADLTPKGLVIQPFWYSRRRPIYIEEQILSAEVRSRNLRTDWNVRTTGAYARGGILEWAGFEVIHCGTELGSIELAVPRPDVPLLLHYLNRLVTGQAHRQPPSEPTTSTSP